MSGDDTNNDALEKTNVVGGDTMRSKIAAAGDVPPAIQVMLGPPGYVGKQYLITTSNMIIGRSGEVAVFIDDRSLSRMHARVDVSPQGVFLTDLQSTNKTLVNGQVLTPNTPRLLKNYDQLKAGNVIFRFVEKGSLETASAQELNERASKDALTGCFSKGALLDQGPQAMKRSEVMNQDLCIITFDIDHFKKINDTYGHPGGDYVLKELCKALTANVIRSSDFFARYGGEEFVLILSGSALPQAIDVAERIRTTVENFPFQFNNLNFQVTVSVGVSSKNSEDKTWNHIYDRADKALYQAKQSGRNRVISL